MGDQDIRTAFQKARRCIARISFYRGSLAKDLKHMVIPGVIVAMQNGVATVVCDPVLFVDCDSFSVTFPTIDSYEEIQTVSSASVVKWGSNICSSTFDQMFVSFQLKPRNGDFVQSTKFELRPPKSGQSVDALTFLRKSFITPASYAEGKIVYGPNAKDKIKAIFEESAMHEYGFLGAPLFNRNGDLVGLTYADTGTLIAHNVLAMQDVMLQYLDGSRYDDPPGHLVVVSSPSWQRDPANFCGGDNVAR